MNAATPSLPASATPEVYENESSARGSVVKKIIGAVLALAALAWGGHAGWHAYRYEHTDNAYIVGHIHQVSAQLAGQVKEVLVADNQVVKAGTPLVRLDSLEFEIAAQKAEAALAQAHAQALQVNAASAQANAQFAEAKARVVQADAQLGQARAQLELAQLTLTRFEKLSTNAGAVTQADVDQSRTAERSAQAALDAASANRTAALAAVGSAEAAQQAASAQATAAQANVAAAQASLRDAQRELAYTTIAAPAEGRVGNKNVEPGNRVAAGQTILAIAEPAPWVVANFKETQLTRMQPGQEVEISVDALGGEKVRGTIESLSPASGAQFALLPADNATGNFNKVVQRVPVKILLATEDPARLGDRLRLGYSVIVDVRVR